ncbi:hypothetical protein BC832DRAFT_590074 [Gaertneriomyces semiglobifer]|nr:hypothetical protein BC832DRAFT_590074 [Gaertneriomyces semiglobifer]
MNAAEDLSPVSAYEAERIAEQLRTYRLEDVGNDKWLAHHQVVEKLNIQAHYNVSMNNEEFVTEALILYDKIPALIHDLILTDIWKTRIFPKIPPEAISTEESLRIYFLLYHEVTVLNLLEIVLYKQEACVAAGDPVLDLVDYCSRKMTMLSTWDDVDIENDKSAKEYLDLPDSKRILTLNETLRLQTALQALAIFRYLSDHITHLPLSVMTRILNTNDMVCLAVNVLQRRCWERKRIIKSGGRKEAVLERFDVEKGIWGKVERGEWERLSKLEGQVWLCLYNLLLERECQRKYEYITHNHSVVLQLREHMSQTLLDQLPVLADLYRYLEELSLLNPPTHPALSALSIQQVPEIYDNILRTANFEQLANKVITDMQGGGKTKGTREAVLRSLADTYSLPVLTELLPDDPKCANPDCINRSTHMATQRCSRCKHEWYCSRPCQVKHWKAHKPMCDILSVSKG